MDGVLARVQRSHSPPSFHLIRADRLRHRGVLRTFFPLMVSRPLVGRTRPCPLSRVLFHEQLGHTVF